MTVNGLAIDSRRGEVAIYASRGIVPVVTFVVADYLLSSGAVYDARCGFIGNTRPSIYERILVRRIGELGLRVIDLHDNVLSVEIEHADLSVYHRVVEAIAERLSWDRSEIDIPYVASSLKDALGHFYRAEP